MCYAFIFFHIHVSECSIQTPYYWMISAYLYLLYLVGCRKGRPTFKVFKSIQRDRKEDAMFSVVIPAGFR